RQDATWMSLAAVALAFGWAVRPGSMGAGFEGMYLRDDLTRVVDLAALATAGIAILLSSAYVARVRLPAGEYHALLLLSTVGAMIMAASASLVTLFLGLEILSFPLYVLSALARRSRRSQEAGLKYLLLGAFATAFFVYGVALIFGATGSFELRQIAGASRSPLLGTGIALLTIGLALAAAA